MLPVETILAVFPSTARVGNLTLRPLTLYHATAMDTMGVDVTDQDGVDEDHVLIAAWFMSMTPDEVVETMTSDRKSERFERWMECVGEMDVADVVDTVNREIAACMAANVPGANDGKQEMCGPRGYGWTLELGEAVAHEYAISFHDAMSIPLVRVFGMIAACRRRNGGRAGGPDYYERILTKNIREIMERMKNG